MRALKANSIFLILISTAFCMQISSQVAVMLIGIAKVVPPYAIVNTLNHHFYMESLTGIFTGLLGLSIGSMWYKGGILRYLAEISLATVIAVVFFGILGAWFFIKYEGLPSMSLRHFIPFMEASGDVVYEHFILGEVISFSLMGLLVGGIVWEKYRPARRALGTAHFASGLEVQKAQFFKKADGGILIGKKYGVPLWSSGYEHVLVFSPTGSGKTRSISIPNLFQYPYSVVCNDVKLSLYETTSGFRENVLGHKCFCWSPTSSKTHRFNPLTFISDDKIKRMTDIQKIAHILIPENKKDPIWSQASRKLFKTIVLYLLDTPEKPVSLGEINRVIKHPSFDSWLDTLLNETEHYDPEFYRNGFSYITNHEKTRGSIKESFTGYFELFDDPTIDAATSVTDFDITALRRDKITVYIGFTDDDMERLSPLLTLFWQQFISSMIQRVPDPKEEPYPVLCLVDEFSSLGRIERLRRSLKLLREYRVRCVLMMQYIGQTYEQYSKDEARAFTNIKTKIAYSVEDFQDAEYISKLLGMRTKRVSSGSLTEKEHGYSESRSYNYQSVPLLRPEEIMRMPDKNTLIIRTGHAPVKAKQFIWYKEPVMKSLPLPGSFIPEQEVTINPFDHNEKKDRERDRGVMSDDSGGVCEFV